MELVRPINLFKSLFHLQSQKSRKNVIGYTAREDVIHKIGTNT